MKISDLIKELEELKEKFGDLPVYAAIHDNACEDPIQPHFDIFHRTRVQGRFDEVYPERIVIG